MSSSQIILYLLIALGPIAALLALWQVLTGPRLVSKLMLRYLMKRRIAWVSLIAVMLCTAMVLIVISVMGGWLRMFRETNHDLIGDLIVYRQSLDGFSGYEQMMAGIRDIPEVKAVTPTIHTWGFAEIGGSWDSSQIRVPVEVVGVDLKQIGEVNGFVRSLHLQPDALLAWAKQLEDSAASAKARAATRASSSDFLQQAEASSMEADAQDEQAMAQSLQAKAALFPSWDKPLPSAVYSDQGFKGTPTRWGGIIVGSGVIGLRGNDEREDFIYRARVKLTALKASDVDVSDPLQAKTVTNNYWLIDDSHTNVFQVDTNRVYLPFDELQTQLEMNQQQATDATTGKSITIPARCTELLISVKPGSDLEAVKSKVSDVVNDVLQKNNLAYTDAGELKVETWYEHQQDFLNAVEHEESLLVILFGVISIVAIFLIFCIFFMIVMEKTRDIGIIKSVGATGANVAAIFLGYGLSIGIVGGGMGLLLAYLVVHNINELHAWMGRHLGIEIWNAKTYLFDTIPNTMEQRDVVIIVSVAILSSVLGALVPAIRAARMNPVDALRWE
jgi:lipoprotein-releasing system permease protein